MKRRIESARKTTTDHDSKRGTTNPLCPKIRSKTEVIHDTSDALEAKETLVEAVLEVVGELPKTLEATRGRLVLEKIRKTLPVRGRGQENLTSEKKNFVKSENLPEEVE